MQYTVENVKCNDGERKSSKAGTGETKHTHTLLKYLMSSCVVDSLIMQKKNTKTNYKENIFEWFYSCQEFGIRRHLDGIVSGTCSYSSGHPSG